jgi:hypothetical protein
MYAPQCEKKLVTQKQFKKRSKYCCMCLLLDSLNHIQGGPDIAGPISPNLPISSKIFGRFFGDIGLPVLCFLQHLHIRKEKVKYFIMLSFGEIPSEKIILLETGEQNK